MQRAFGKGFYSDPNSPVSRLHTVTDIPAEMWRFQNQNSGPPFLSGATVERVCASFLRRLKILALCCGFVYKRVENVQCTAVLCINVWKMYSALLFCV